MGRPGTKTLVDANKFDWHGVNVSLYRQPNSPYIWYYFRWKGKTYRQSSKQENNKRAAEVAAKAIDDLRLGLDPTKKMEFPYCARKWLERKLSDEIKEQTKRTYKSHFRFVLEFYKKYRIDEITTEIVNEYVVWRKSYYTWNPKRVYIKRDGKKLKGRQLENVGPSTINKEIMILSSILDYWRDAFPPGTIKKLGKIRRDKEHIRKETLDGEDFGRLLSYYMERNPYYAKVLEFLSLTGLRFPSETKNLTWKNVHIKKRILEVLGRKGEGQGVDTAVPLVSRAVQILQELKSREGIPTGKDDYVFLNDEGKHIVSFRKSFNHACEKLGIKRRDVCMYTMRHFFTKNMLQRGMSEVTVSRILGHSSTKMVIERYGWQKYDEVLRQTMELDEKMNERKTFVDPLEIEKMIKDKGMMEAMKTKEWQDFVKAQKD